MIFGGFHLKQTFELAFCCAASFAHARPTFISADPCTFRNPVPVGSVLYLTATVAYTDPPLVSTISVFWVYLLMPYRWRRTEASLSTRTLRTP